MSVPLNPGDRVAYARCWLTSTQAHDLGAARGTVVTTGPGRLVHVEWDGKPREYQPIYCTNLVRVDRIHLETY